MSDRFHHLSLAPKDWDASVAFYRDTLHYAVTDTWGGHGLPRGTMLSGGGMRVIIVENAGTKEPRDMTPRIHLDIHDLDARFAEIGPGAHVVTPPEDTPWGTRWFVLRDPDGTLIAFEEIHQHGR